MLHRIINRIIVDTTIKELGLKEKLNVKQLTQFRNLAHDYMKIKVEYTQIKRRKGVEKAQQDINQKISVFMPKMVEIIDDEEILRKFLDTIEELSAIVGQIVIR